MNNNIKIAMTIKQQIGGNKTFLMLGVKNPVAIDNGLGFKIMRNAKGINYADMLRGSIEKNTGLYIRL